MLKRIFYVFFLWFLISTGSVLAAEVNQDDAFDLGDIVVTGQKVGIADIGISDVITMDDIKATNAKTVADAMKFVPGVVVTRGRKNEPEISIHGFGQEKSQFLIDGIPYYETNYGKLSLDQIPVGIIARIEISKNAPSVLYGPNAQIAVINVITKKGTLTPTFSLNGEVGENNTVRGALSHGNTIGGVNYWISYNHEESDGWRLSSDFEPEIAQRARFFMPNVDGIHENGGFRSNSDFERDRLWARFGITPSQNSEYFLSVHLMDSEMGHPPATNEYKIYDTSGDDAGFSTFSRFEDYDDWGMDLSGKQMITNALTLRGKLFYHNHEDVYASYDGPDYETVIARSSYQDELYGTVIIADFNLMDAHEGHVSLHYRKDCHDSRDGGFQPFNEYASYTGSVGTEQSYYFDTGLSVYAGVAYDWWKVDKAEDYVFDDDDLLIGQVALDTPSESQLNPMLGFTYDLDQFETTFFGSAARKTQFPTLFQLYSSSGNPDLDSEVSINYTLGVTKHFGSKYSVDVSGFYHDISDWISRDYYEDDFTGDEIYMNVEDVTMVGIETSAKAKFCDYFSMNLNYTYNNAENKSSKAATGKVIGVPEQKLGVGFNMLIPIVLVSLDMQGIYVDEMYDNLPTTGDTDADITKSDDYFIINSRISKTFKEQYEMYAEVDNIMDENYYEEVGFPAYGRNFRVGFNLNF